MIPEASETQPNAPATITEHEAQQRANGTGLQPVEMPNRGHALTIDSGWREVADKSLAFVRRFI